MSDIVVLAMSPLPVVGKVQVSYGSLSISCFCVSCNVPAAEEKRYVPDMANRALLEVCIAALSLVRIVPSWLGVCVPVAQCCSGC